MGTFFTERTRLGRLLVLLTTHIAYALQLAPPARHRISPIDIHERCRMLQTLEKARPVWSN